MGQGGGTAISSVQGWGGVLHRLGLGSQAGTMVSSARPCLPQSQAGQQKVPSWETLPSPGPSCSLPKCPPAWEGVGQYTCVQACACLGNNGGVMGWGKPTVCLGWGMCKFPPVHLPGGRGWGLLGGLGVGFGEEHDLSPPGPTKGCLG